MINIADIREQCTFEIDKLSIRVFDDQLNMEVVFAGSTYELAKSQSVYHKAALYAEIGFMYIEDNVLIVELNYCHYNEMVDFCNELYKED